MRPNEALQLTERPEAPRLARSSVGRFAAELGRSPALRIPRSTTPLYTAILARLRGLTLPCRSALLGALAAALLLVIHPGWFLLYPADAFLSVLWLLLVSAAATLGAGLALAWQHVTAAPRVLIRTVPLMLLSVWMLWSFESRRRGVPEMLARADSSQSVVLGKNVFRSLVVLGRYPDDVGRLIAPWKREHMRLSSGDSIVIYFERERPYELLDVAPAGPEILVTLHRFDLALDYWRRAARRLRPAPEQTDRKTATGDPRRRTSRWSGRSAPVSLGFGGCIGAGERRVGARLISHRELIRVQACRTTPSPSS